MKEKLKKAKKIKKAQQKAREEQEKRKKVSKKKLNSVKYNVNLFFFNVCIYKPINRDVFHLIFNASRFSNRIRIQQKVIITPGKAFKVQCLNAFSVHVYFGKIELVIKKSTFYDKQYN